MVSKIVWLERFSVSSLQIQRSDCIRLFLRVYYLLRHACWSKKMAFQTIGHKILLSAGRRRSKCSMHYGLKRRRNNVQLCCSWNFLFCHFEANFLSTSYDEETDFFCSYVRHRPPWLRMMRRTFFFLSDFFPSNEINFQIGYWKVAQDK